MAVACSWLESLRRGSTRPPTVTPPVTSLPTMNGSATLGPVCLTTAAPGPTHRLFGPFLSFYPNFLLNFDLTCSNWIFVGIFACPNVPPASPAPGAASSPSPLTGSCGPSAGNCTLQPPVFKVPWLSCWSSLLLLFLYFPDSNSLLLGPLPRLGPRFLRRPISIPASLLTALVHCPMKLKLP